MPLQTQYGTFMLYSYLDNINVKTCKCLVEFLIPLSTHNSRKIQRCMSGDITSGVLITEFDTGSDLHAVNANAVLNEDVYIITGAKTFITSGQLVDLLTVVTKKDLAAGAKGTILFLVEVGTLSFEKGMKLKNWYQGSRYLRYIILIM